MDRREENAVPRCITARDGNFLPSRYPCGDPRCGKNFFAGTGMEKEIFLKYCSGAGAENILPAPRGLRP